MVKEYIDNDGRYLVEPTRLVLPKISEVKPVVTLPLYLATPYSKFPTGLYEAYDMACEMTAYMLEKGYFVFSPIVHSHHTKNFVSSENRMSHDFWLDIDFKFIRVSSGLVVVKMAGWQESYGITKEIEFASQLNLPIHYTNFLEIPATLKKGTKDGL